MALEAGARLGPYEVVAPLGAGGMGEVYRARDPRLGREVAIKVLPNELSRDPDRLRRFEREARAAGAVNHPNILDVHDIGTHEGSPYVVSELLEGETLRQRLHPGALSIRQATDYSVQLLRGLAAAHEKGIVHRDLKPENIFVTKDGRVKILDFGLAKLTSEPLFERALSTAGRSQSTVSGAVVGTVGYMSPEQVRAEAVDHRADIFAFGAVLYEMLAGRQAFRGATPAETLSAILREDPPALSGPRSGISPGLERVVRRCLAKHPGARFRSADDIAFALEDVSQAQVTPPGRRRLAGRMLAPTAALGLLVAGVLWFFRHPDRSGSTPAPMTVHPLTTLVGQESQPALSPDGSQVAFMWDRGEGTNFDIYLKRIDAETMLRLTESPDDDCCPSWSPDGGSIAFVRSRDGAGEVLVVPALGGPERRLATIRGRFLVSSYHAWLGSSVSWSPDGTRLAFSDAVSPGSLHGIFSVSVAGLERRRLTEPPEGTVGDVRPVFSPDGKSLAFVRNRGTTAEIYVVPAEGGRPRRLLPGGGVILGLDWSPDGSDIVFSSWPGLKRLWRVAASGGDPVSVTAAGEDALSLSIARHRSRLAYSRQLLDTNVYQAEAAGARGASPHGPLIASTTVEKGARYSPDGRRIAFGSRRSGSEEIWVCNSDGSKWIQLTSSGRGFAGSPSWSPDGRQIAYDARLEGQADIYVVDVDTRLSRRFTAEPSDDIVPSWSTDGRWLYFASHRGGTQEVWRQPVGGGAAVQLTSGGGFMALESPDGEYVYFTKPDARGIWRIPAGGGPETLVTDRLAAGLWSYWAVTGVGLYYYDREAQPIPAIDLLDLASGEITPVVTLAKGAITVPSGGLSVSPDGRWLLYTRTDLEGSDLMLLDGFR